MRGVLTNVDRGSLFAVYLVAQAVIESRRAERQPSAESLIQDARSTLNRFTGGGFNLNQPAS